MMNKAEYESKRLELMNVVQRNLEEGDSETAQAIMDEVETLDNDWEEYCHEVANKASLTNGLQVSPVSYLGDNGVVAESARNASVVDTTRKIDNEVIKMDLTNMKREDVLKSDIYTTAWAKSLMGRPLTEDENVAYRMVNDDDFTHTVGDEGSAGVVVPDTVATGIWSEVEDMYPYFADITKTNVNGLLTIVRATESTEAEWYDEETETATGKETFDTLQLAGCELSRAISVSWKLKEMAIADFIPYIQRRMAEAMGAALGYGVVQGKGADADKPEPMGIITALEAEKNQVVTGELNYKNVTKARGLIKSGYAGGIAVYANGTTIWDGLANVCDDEGHPLFIHDVAGENGVFRVLGMVVKEDASIPDNYVLLSNASRGYQGNVNKDITVVTEDHARHRITDYVGYAIFDGAPLTYKAHSLLKVGE